MITSTSVRGAFLGIIAATLVSGCVTTQHDNSPGRTSYDDPSQRQRLSGVGIESQDIIAATDQMMRDMLANPILAGRSQPPRVIIDSEFFRNESSSVVNRNQLTDRLRVQLNRAANGRMVFVGRHYADMVEQERQLKRDGVVDGGTIRSTAAPAGGDYRLGGRITSLDAMSRDSQERSRYHQIVFEMVDLELQTIVWSGIYEFQRTAQDNVIYR